MARPRFDSRMPAGTGDLQIIHVFPLLKVKQSQLTEHQDLWLDDIPWMLWIGNLARPQIEPSRLIAS